MRRLLLLVAAIALSAVAAQTSCPGPAQTAPTRATQTTAAAAMPSVERWPAAAADEGGEQLARPSCFGDLLAIDKAAGFDGVRLAFARGLSDDELAAEYLAERVAELIGASPERALEMLAWAKEASPADAEVLLAGIAASAGGKDPRVALGLLALGEGGADERVRLAALDALRTQPRLDDDGRARLKGLALVGTNDELAWRAARALGSVMNESQRGAQPDQWQPYWDDLMDIAGTSTDAGVRAIALEAPLYSDPILPAANIAELTQLMLDEPHRDVRELAAFQLSLTDSPSDALEAFRRAFEQEYDECVRWAIVRFAVRAAGASSLPLLEHFARIDAAFVADVADFRALFAAGYQDFEQIWLHKAERHACVVEDGEVHGAGE